MCARSAGTLVGASSRPALPTRVTRSGRTLILLGLTMPAVGVLVSLAAKLGLPKPGRLPGDIVYRGSRWTFYVPLTMCLLVSALVTLIFLVFGRR